MHKLIFLLPLLLLSCQTKTSNEPFKNEIAQLEQEVTKPVELEMINPKGMTVETRFNVPQGFKRPQSEPNSFAAYLQNLPLKPNNSAVYYYNGDMKFNNGVYAAVVNLPIGKKNLHQCADAVIRLRGEWQFENELYDQISFNFTNGFKADYSKWMNGQRIVVKGNKCSWVNSRAPSNTYDDFWNYMERVFTYAGTLSLSKELNPIEITEMKIGDVFIQGGSPGHSIIVVDMATNQETGQKVFMLAQSYMPAQEIQILENPNNQKQSPWYSLKESGSILTPEWSFKNYDLKRF